MHLKTTIAALGVATALAVTAGAAGASTVYFNLGGPTDTNEWSFSYSQHGVDLTVSGLVCDDGKGPNSSSCKGEKIDRYTSGIAMEQKNDSSHQVDGAYSNEFLKLAFNPAITLTKLQFTYASKNDDFHFYTWNGSSWSESGPYEACPNQNWTCGENGTAHWYTFGTPYTGSMFLVGARGADDDWKLKGVKVEYQPSVVPLPAAGWMLLAGLGGIAALKRRKAA
jgi:hypothetical protein